MELDIKEHNQRMLEDQHKLLIGLEQDSAKTFDQAVYLISAGTIALSLSILKDFAIEPNMPGFLFFAWAALVLAILIHLLSPLLSMKASQEQRRINQDYYLKEEATDFEENKYSKWTGRSNLWSAILVIAGVFSFLIFVFINYTDMKNKNIITYTGTAAESAVPPKPLLKMEGTKSDVIKSVVPPTPPPKVTPVTPSGQSGGNQGGGQK